MLPHLRASELTPAARELHDQLVQGPRAASTPLTDADGRLQGPFGALVHHPAVGQAISGLGEQIRFHGVLPARWRELAVLEIAAFHDSDFEWSVHAPIAAAVGLDDATIHAIGRGGVLDGDDGTISRFVRSVLHERRIERDLAEAVRALSSVGDPGYVELVALVSYYGLLALLIESMDDPGDG